MKKARYLSFLAVSAMLLTFSACKKVADVSDANMTVESATGGSGTSTVRRVFLSMGHSSNGAWGFNAPTGGTLVASELNYGLTGRNLDAIVNPQIVGAGTPGNLPFDLLNFSAVEGTISRSPHWFGGRHNLGVTDDFISGTEALIVQLGSSLNGRMATSAVANLTGTASSATIQPLLNGAPVGSPQTVTLGNARPITATGNVYFNGLRISATGTGNVSITGTPGRPREALQFNLAPGLAPPVAAYSVRKFISDYSGSAIKVRRSTDNALQDIGFTGSGDLDTTALKTFVGSASGFVHTWYDQSGNGRHVTQATAGSQPRIVNAGMLEKNSANRPFIHFDGGDDLRNNAFVLTTQPVSTSSVWRVRSLTAPGAELFGWGSNSVDGDRFGVWFNQTTATSGRFGVENRNGGMVGTTALNTNKWYVSSQILPGSSLPALTQWINKVSQSMTNILTPKVMNITGGQFAIGTVPMTTAHRLHGDIQEVVYYSFALSDPDRQNIENGQCTYYGLCGTEPTPPVVEEGFVAGTTNLAGARWRVFNPASSWEMAVGKGIPTVPITTWTNGDLNWKLSGANPISFSYNSTTGVQTATADDDDASLKTLTMTLPPQGAMNYMQIAVKTEAGKSVEFKNVILTVGGVDYPLGNFSSTGGDKSWMIRNFDFSGGFSIRGEMVLVSGYGSSLDANTINVRVANITP